MKALGAGYFASSDFASVSRRLPGPLVLPEALRGAAAYRGGKKGRAISGSAFCVWSFPKESCSGG